MSNVDFQAVAKDAIDLFLEFLEYDGGAGTVRVPRRRQCRGGPAMNMMMSPNIDQLAGAMAKAQAAAKSAVKDASNPHLKKSYADLTSITEACREALTANGVAAIQVGVRAEDGEPWLRTVLMHASGQWIAGELPLVLGEPKGISLMQALGSAITYARRYGLAGAAGVITEDDDGHSAGQKAQTNGAAAVRPAPPAQAVGPQAPPVAQPVITDIDVQAIREILVAKNVPEQDACWWASKHRTKVLAELTAPEGILLWNQYKS